LKGIALTNYSQLNISIPGGKGGIRIWDVADYVVPPQVSGWCVTAEMLLLMGIVVELTFLQILTIASTFSDDELIVTTKQV
jgi:hypothetical protein